VLERFAITRARDDATGRHAIAWDGSRCCWRAAPACPEARANLDLAARAYRQFAERCDHLLKPGKLDPAKLR
jgi:hypothetical protein